MIKKDMDYMTNLILTSNDIHSLCLTNAVSIAATSYNKKKHFLLHITEFTWEINYNWKLNECNSLDKVQL
jgi:hypothetical protein